MESAFGMGPLALKPDSLPSFQMMAPKVYEQAIKVYNWPFAATLAFVLMGVTFALTILSSITLQKRYGAV